MSIQARLTERTGQDEKNADNSLQPRVTSNIPDITPFAISAGAPKRLNNEESGKLRRSIIFRSIRISEKQ